MRTPILFCLVALMSCSAEIPTSPLAVAKSQGQTGTASKRRAAAPPIVPPPQCSSPAPYLSHPENRAPGYIVVYKQDVDPVATTARLASKYGFSPTHVYAYALRGFSALLSAQTVTALRCEPEVSYVDENAYAQGGS